MDGLKTSTITKSKHTKEVCEEFGYDPNTNITTKMYNEDKMEQKILDVLINDINSLESYDHMIIYSLLRTGGIEKNFFSHGKKIVHFDIAKLPNELKWKLQMHVKMTKENNARQQIITCANEDHNKIMSNLDKTLTHPQDNRESTSTSMDLNNKENAETKKYEKMLKLNNRVVLAK
jgi:hypothetical protein